MVLRRRCGLRAVIGLSENVIKVAEVSCASGRKVSLTLQVKDNSCGFAIQHIQEEEWGE